MAERRLNTRALHSPARAKAADGALATTTVAPSLLCLWRSSFIYLLAFRAICRLDGCQSVPAPAVVNRHSQLHGRLAVAVHAQHLGREKGRVGGVGKQQSRLLLSYTHGTFTHALGRGVSLFIYSQHLGRGEGVVLVVGSVGAWRSIPVPPAPFSTYKVGPSSH